MPRGFYISTDDIFDEASWSDPIYFDELGLDQDVSAVERVAQVWTATYIDSTSAVL